MPILRELLNNIQYKYLESFKTIFLPTALGSEEGGFNEIYDDGYNDGFEQGTYDAGYDDGYDDGYDGGGNYDSDRSGEPEPDDD